MDLSAFFDAVYLVNLQRRPDRLAAARREMESKGWPFAPPIVFEAVDAHLVPTPYGWESGGGAYGCRMSHCRIIELALMRRHNSFLVLEDDFCLRSDFPATVERFLADVPADWQLLFLGGQHMQEPRRLKPGVVGCTNTQRTHALAWRNGRMLREVYSLWMSTRSTTHIDWQLGPLCDGFPVYAPNPFLIGQGGGASDICGRANPPKFWVPPTGKEPVLLLHVPREVLPALRARGVHTGHQRDPATDIDWGLHDVFAEGDRVAKLKKWLRELQEECVSEEGKILGVWHPQATADLLRRCWRGPIQEIQAQTVEEAIGQLPTLVSADAASGAAAAKRQHVVLLEADKSTVVLLRALGWHTGYWRDPITDQDNGLRQWRREKNKHRLAAIIDVLVQEAEDIPGGVPCLWHPELTMDQVREATVLPVVEIRANDAEEALSQWRQANI